MAELPDDVYDEIKRLCADGDALAQDGAYKEAIAEYNKAWKLIPMPKGDWNASLWVVVAIADAAFLGNNFKMARKALDSALALEQSIGNPFVHLRNGQVHFEDGELDDAAQHLMLAYMSEGKAIFENDDPKYYAFLKTRARDLE
ncbi:MAG: tetratricopeptide repeat protein [Myxococcota bacterium]